MKYFSEIPLLPKNSDMLLKISRTNDNTDTLLSTSTMHAISMIWLALFNDQDLISILRAISIPILYGQGLKALSASFR